MLHARTRDADRVALLEGILADGSRRHLTGNDHHRDGVHIRRGNAGDGIGDTGTGRDERNPYTISRARVGIGRVQRSLFVPDEYMAYRVLLEKLVVQVQDGTARIPEHVFDLFFRKAPDYNFRSGQ